MKRIKSLLVLSAFGTLALSCAKEAEFTPGGAENDNPYDVGFVVPESTSYNLASDDPTELTFTVKRAYSEDEITVPVELVAGNTISEGVFSKTELKFAKGAATADIVVSFPKIEDGVTYSVILEINDPEYVHVYSNNARSLRFSVIREKWNLLGKAKFVDNWTWSSGTAYECDLEQSGADQNKFRLYHPYNEAIVAEKVNIKDGNDPSEYINFRVLKLGEKVGNAAVTVNDLVLFDTYYTGETHATYNAPIAMLHPRAFYPEDVDEWSHNRVLSWQDNGLPGVVQFAAAPYMFGLGGWANYLQTDGMIEITFPGYTPVDYEIDVEQAGYSEDGKVSVYFDLGKDLAKLRYVFAEGTMSDAAAHKIAETLKDDTTAGEVSAESVLELAPGETTGVYTIVVAGYDAAGELQSSAQAQIKFVAAGDARPVILNGGIIISDKYASDETSTSKNSAEIFINGTDLSMVNYTLLPAEFYEANKELCDEVVSAPGRDYDELGATIAETVSTADAETLSAINGGGFSDIVKKLESETEYVLVIYATNGYSDKYEVFTGTTK